MDEHANAFISEDDPFGDPLAGAKGAAQGGEQAETEALEPARTGYIDPAFKIQSNNAISSASTDFATAYAVAGKRSLDEEEAYALVFDRQFPIQHDTLQALSELDMDTMSRVLDSGKIEVGGAERLAAVVTKPKGKKLSEVIKEKGAFEEAEVRHNIVKPLASALVELHQAGVMHGNINANTVYYDLDSGQVGIAECLSSYPGFEQQPIYESLNRLICLPEAKGNKDVEADFFAVGVVALFALTGREPLKGRSTEEIITLRMEHGSHDALCEEFITEKHLAFQNMQAILLMRGLLTDHDDERWDSEYIMDWSKKRHTSTMPPSRIHKETSTPFLFDEKEYFGRKYLAYDLFCNWGKAKTEIKVEEVSRWLKLGLKLPKVSDLVDAQISVSSAELVLSDDKLSRLIHLLDPKGPIRFQEFAISIFAVGNFLAYGYMQGKRNYLQGLAAMLVDGLVEQWINIQDHPEEYSFSNLLWTPYKATQHIRKTGLGFGMERVLYMLNQDMPCQSPILADFYTQSLQDVLLALDNLAKKKEEEANPIDRHSAAFIAEQIDLQEEIRIKSIQGHKALSGNPQLMMLALLTVAQSSSGMRSLKGVTSWMKTRLLPISDNFHNGRIKTDFKKELEKTSKTGSLNDLFKAVSNPSFVKRDQSGFLEAKKQYRMLTQEIYKHGKQTHIEKIAYQYGLRISVMFAYFVLIMTLLLVVMRSA